MALKLNVKFSLLNLFTIHTCQHKKMRRRKNFISCPCPPGGCGAERLLKLGTLLKVALRQTCHNLYSLLKGFFIVILMDLSFFQSIPFFSKFSTSYLNLLSINDVCDSDMLTQTCFFCLCCPNFWFSCNFCHQKHSSDFFSYLSSISSY